MVFIQLYPCANLPGAAKKSPPSGVSDLPSNCAEPRWVPPIIPQDQPSVKPPGPSTWSFRPRHLHRSFWVFGQVAYWECKKLQVKSASWYINHRRPQVVQHLAPKITFSKKSHGVLPFILKSSPIKYKVYASLLWTKNMNTNTYDLFIYTYCKKL